MNIKRRNKANPEFSLAAMVDVILLLLIFFMVTSAASNVSAIQVNLPQNAADSPAIKDPVEITVKVDGTYYLNDQPIQAESIEPELKKLFTSGAQPAFSIRADQNALHKNIVFLMEIAERNHYQISIATVRE